MKHQPVIHAFMECFITITGTSRNILLKPLATFSHSWMFSLKDKAIVFSKQVYVSSLPPPPLFSTLWPFPKHALVSTCRQFKFFINTVEKGEIAHYEQFLRFPQCFLPFIKYKNIKLSSASYFCLEESKFCCLGRGLTHSHTMTPFDAPGKQAFWKHWEKEKLLITSNFSFTHSVFYLFRELSAIFIKFKIVVCRLFQFGPV